VRREDFLRRLPDGPPDPAPPRPGRRTERGREARLDLFLARLADLGVKSAVYASLDAARLSVGRLCADRGWSTIASAAADRWELESGTWTGEAHAASFGLCHAYGAIAATGTIVLRHEGDDARGHSLLPRATGFIVKEDDIRDCMADVLRDLDALGPALPAAVTLVTGPSNTADIAGVKCVGAHGPAEVVVWVVTA
jgi:hypothetical protein